MGLRGKHTDRRLSCRWASTAPPHGSPCGPLPGTTSGTLAGATPAAWTLPSQVHGARSFSTALLTFALGSGSLNTAVPTAQPAPPPHRGWLSVWVTPLSQVSGACLAHEAAQRSLAEWPMRALSCSGSAWPRPSGLFCNFSCLQKSGNGSIGPKQLPAEGPISGLGPRHAVAWGMGVCRGCDSTWLCSWATACSAAAVAVSLLHHCPICAWAALP